MSSLSLRLPDSLHRHLKRAAEVGGIHGVILQYNTSAERAAASGYPRLEVRD